MAEVDALIQKANGSLRGASEEKKAEIIKLAIETCQEALALLEEIPGLSEGEKEKKASEIMSVIYWCRKMTPLDLSGRELATASSSAGKGPSSGAEEGADHGARTGPQVDELAFARAKDYARKNPNDLDGALLRYEGVAASFPRSRWGMDAAREAALVRAKIEQLRAAAAKAIGEMIQRLELEAAVASLARDMAGEGSPAKKEQLRRMTDGVERLMALQARLVATLESLNRSLSVPFGELGLEKAGWVKAGGKKGVSVSLEAQGAPRTEMAWSEFGARAAVHLAEKLLNLSDSATVEELVVAATVAEDPFTAYRLFERLLLAAPERVADAAEYFERAHSGYKASSEGSARLRFKEAKDLITKRKVKEGFALLTEIQRGLAKDSALRDLLSEVDAYRRSMMRQHGVNDRGEKLSAFEKTVRKAFGGDAKLDEQTGAVEVVYDFSSASQLKDWATVAQYGQPSRSASWTVSGGAAKCRGDKAILMWNFPITRFDFTAEVTYDDATSQKQTIIYTCMNDKNPHGVRVMCRGGAARLQMGDRGYWSAKTRFVWRPGEVATVRFAHEPGRRYPFEVTVNDQYAISGYIFRQGVTDNGCIGFGFDGGTGSVDNVAITGILDMDWFRKATANAR